MVLDNGEEELNLTMKLNVDGFEYTVYATTDALPCFHCGCVGRVVHDCPRKKSNSADRAPKVAEPNLEGPPATAPLPAEDSVFAHEAHPTLTDRRNT